MLQAWIRAFRPKTLTAAVVPILVGTALVWAMEFSVDWVISICALLASLFIQIATNLFNDAIDFKKGADTSNRIGPKRMTQSGVFSSKQVMVAGGMSLLLAVGFGIPLIIAGGIPILVIGGFSVLLAYSYTGGPFPLAYLGLGDFFVLLFFGVIAVMGLCFVHTGEFFYFSFVAGLQVGALATVLIVINNLRDREGDAKVGKRTLAVHLGEKWSKLELISLMLTPFFLGFFWWQENLTSAAILPLLAFPLAVRLMKQIWQTSPSEVYNRFLARAAILHLVFGVLLSLGLVLK